MNPEISNFKLPDFLEGGQYTLQDIRIKHKWEDKENEAARITKFQYCLMETRCGSYWHEADMCYTKRKKAGLKASNNALKSFFNYARS